MSYERGGRDRWHMPGDDRDGRLDDDAPVPGKRPLTRFLRKPTGAPTAPAASAGVDVPAGGEPLAEDLRARFAPRIGGDLAGVTVSTSAESARAADAMAARAFTVGRDIHFGAGEYAPGTPSGDRLLAHELVHTLQPDQGAIQRKPDGSGDDLVSSPHEPAEAEADAIADRVAADLHAGDGHALAPAAAPIAARRPVLHRDPKGDAPTLSLDAKEYAVRFGTEISAELKLLMHGATLDLDSAYASWSGGASKFITMVLGSAVEIGMTILGAGDLHGALTQSLGQSPDAAINRGRDAGADGKGPAEYKAGVALELRILLVGKLNASLARIVPRYLRARNQALLAIEPGSGKTDAEPAVASVIAGHPLDRPVIGALCSHTISFDAKKYRADNPDEAAKHDLPGLRPVALSFMFAQGMGKWVRANPPNASAEEVAKELYGDEARAHLLIAAPPTFAFQVDAMTAVWKARWVEEANKPENHLAVSDPTLAKILDPKNGDPIHQAQHSPAGGYAMLGQAKGFAPTGAKRPDIVDRLRLIYNELVAAYAHAAKLGTTNAFGDIKDRMDKTSRLANDPAVKDEVVLPWDAQTARQLQIVSAASGGLRTAATLYQNAVKGNDVRKLPASVYQPAVEVGDAYSQALGCSDLVETAGAKLTEAETLSKAYPIKVLENVLAHVREMVRSMKGHETIAGNAESDYGIAAMEKREVALRKKLVDARELIAKDPGAAQKIVDEVQKDTEDLEGEAGICVNMDVADQASQELWSLRSALGNISWPTTVKPGITVPGTSKNKIYEELCSELGWLHTRWQNVHRLWTTGKKPEAMRQANEIRKDPNWATIHGRIAAAVEQQELREKWVKIGVMCGVAIVSGGLGAAVGGMMVGTSFAAAAGATTFGVEIVTFTALSHYVEGDARLSSFMKDLAINAAMVGALRQVSKGYAAVMGGADVVKASRILGAGDFTSQVFAASLIQIGIMQATKPAGQQVDADEAKHVVLEQAVMFALMLVLERVKGSFLDGVTVPGKWTKRIADINGRRTKTRGDIEAAKGDKTGEQAKKVVDDDLATGKQENALIDELAADPETKDIDAIKQQKEANDASARKQKLAMAVSPLEPAGPGVYRGDGAQVATAKESLAHPDTGATVKESTDPVTGKKVLDVTPREGDPFRVLEASAKATEAPEAVDVEGKKILTGKELEAAKAKLRERYPTICELPAGTKVYRFAKSEGGIDSHNQTSFWQTEHPNQSYASEFLIESTLGDLRASGEVRLDPYEPAQGDGHGQSIIVIHAKAGAVPGTRVRILGYVKSTGAPVYEPESSMFAEPTEPWRDLDGKMHFPSEEGPLTRKLKTGTKVGDAVTEESIRTGTCKMREHPRFAAVEAAVIADGFTLTEGDGARVEVKETVNDKGELMRTDKTLYYTKDMRFLDLEHEVGHIAQWKANGKPPTDRVILRSDGREVPAPKQEGVLSSWQNKLWEYENRMQEFIRLAERKASREVLVEHRDGVTEWQKAWRKTGVQYSSSKQAYADGAFPHLKTLEARYQQSLVAAGLAP
jgi:hypothetical protein